MLWAAHSDWTTVKIDAGSNAGKDPLHRQHIARQREARRQKPRAAEMEAVSKAMAILSGDDAHDVFTRTFNPALLQMASRSSNGRRQAAQLLSDKASQLHSPRLAALATRVKLDAFEKVKKAIDDLIKALEDEQAAEVKKRDWCIDEFDQNAQDTLKTEHVKKDVVAKISSLDTTIKTLTSEITELKNDNNVKNVSQRTLVTMSASLRAGSVVVDSFVLAQDHHIRICICPRAYLHTQA